jgi:alpha/beta superfamily hydrolase
MEEEIEKIMRQTNYTKEESMNKLTEHNYDTLSVIREYMGIKTKEEKRTKTIQQEMYTQIRKKMDISHFYDKQNEKLAKEIEQNNN